MFLVTCTLQQRREKIIGFVESGDPAIALVLAAADFERTLRRSIIALATAPTADVRLQLERKYNTISKYGMAWNRFVEPTGKPSFVEVFPNFDNVRRAFQTRNELVHGQHGTTGINRAREQVFVVIDATRVVTELSLKYHVDLVKKITTRRRPSARS